MKLYIVGNGFDLSHNLKTSYTEFRLYLLEHRDEVYTDEDLIISKGDILRNFERYCQPNDLWSDFEEQTEKIISEISEGKIIIFEEEWSCKLDIGGERHKFIDCFKKLKKKQDSTFDTEIYHNEIQEYALKYFNNKVRELYIWVPYLYISFQEWIQTIILKNTKNIYEIDEDSSVISFNYTNTMEDVYQQKDVLHLHGSVKNLEDVVLGFHSPEKDDKLPGLETSFTKEFKETQRMFAEQGSRKLNSNKFYDENIGRFYKPVNLLKDSIESFVKNKNIHEVIILGHSYNKIDWVYFKELVRCAPEAKYLFSYYSQNDKENINKIILENKFDIDCEKIHVDNFKIKKD